MGLQKFVPFCAFFLVSVSAERFLIDENALMQSFIDGISSHDAQFPGDIEQWLPSGTTTKDGDSNCWNDTIFFLVSLKQRQTWATQMLDAMGKMPAGLKAGAYTWPGRYRECLEIKVPPTDNDTAYFKTVGFSGQYCKAGWIIPFGNDSIPLTTGICLPDSCRESDMAAAFDVIKRIISNIWFLNSSLANEVKMTISCPPDDPEWSGLGIFCLYMYSLVGSLMLIGTLLEIVQHRSAQEKASAEGGLVSVVPTNDVISASAADVSKDDDSITQSSTASVIPERKLDENTWRDRCVSIFLCFSVYANGKKLFSTSQPQGQLSCVNAIRFLSMCWVILGHTYFFQVSTIDNPVELEKDLSGLAAQIIPQGVFAVDTFFVLSGFLLTYLFVKEIHKTNGKINWAMFYFHRWWRLSPLYYILLASYVGVLGHLDNGPFWEVEGTATDGRGQCSKYWWTNLLYINNWYDVTKQCMGWTWYMANDMQFYVISPLFLFPLWKWPFVGLIVIGILLLTSWVATFTVVYVEQLTAMWSFGTANGNFLAFLKTLQTLSIFFDKIYTKPYCRISAYLVGALLGYSLYKTEQKNFKIPQEIRWILWLLSVALTLSVIYGLYHINMGQIGYCFYNTFSRTVFALGVSWLIFACIRGYGGYVNAMLSWSFWAPLSRLTYCAYLIHPMIMYWVFNGSKASLHFSHMMTVCYFLAVLVMSFGASAVFSLAFESPLLRLEKLLLLNNKKKSDRHVKENVKHSQRPSGKY